MQLAAHAIAKGRETGCSCWSRSVHVRQGGSGLGRRVVYTGCFHRSVGRQPADSPLNALDADKH